MVKGKGTGFGRRLTTLTIAVMAFVSVGFCFETVKCTDKLTNAFWRSEFIEPIEVCYVLMNDMMGYKFTSNYENKIFFNIYNFNKTLEKDGYTFSDIITVIHNHFTVRRFSPRDMRMWRTFRKLGFTGNFYLYVNMNKAIYELRKHTI